MWGSTPKGPVSLEYVEETGEKLFPGVCETEPGEGVARRRLFLSWEESSHQELNLLTP